MGEQKFKSLEEYEKELLEKTAYEDIEENSTEFPEFPDFSIPLEETQLHSLILFFLDHKVRIN